MLCAAALALSQTRSQTKLRDKVIVKYSSNERMSYIIAYTVKSFDDDVPYIVEATVTTKRLKNDSAFKEMFMYSRKDSTVNLTKHYDG